MRMSDKATVSRFIFGIFMVVCAYFKNVYAFLAFYIVAIISDVVDGYVARKLKQDSEHGKKLDILADNFIVLCLIASFYLIKKDILFSYRWQIAALFGYFILVQIINLNARKKLLFMRTYASNIAAIVFPFVVVFFLIFDMRYAAYVYLILMYYALTEKLFLSIFGIKELSIFFTKKLRLKGFFILLFTILIGIVMRIPVMNENNVCFHDGYCIDVETRNTPEGRELGLMFKETLDENEGMLFVFDNPVSYAFWMKNMKMHIDIIFISKDKKIVSISKNALPCDKPSDQCELYYPAGEYMYVVETKANFSERHGLESGQLLTFDLIK